MNKYEQEDAIKGFANHRRIEIIYLLAKEPDLSVDEVAEACNADYKTVAVHLNKLYRSSLIGKKYYGRRVEHRLTKRGEQALQFLKKLR